MLPSINTQDGGELANDWVLVGIGLDLDVTGLVVLNEPCPSGALDASEGSVEGALELLKGAKLLVNGRLMS